MFNPIYRVSPQLLRTIKQITILVYDLNRRQVPALALAQLLSDAQVTSTYASTSIEGNPLPLTEVRKLLKNQPQHIRDSEREVLNYNHVLTKLNQQQHIAFTTDLLLEIHAGVTDKLLPQHQIAAWRQEPVVIDDPKSGGIVYLPPDHSDVPQLMKELVTYVQRERDNLDPLLLAGIFHKQFVAIHPFMDGNGRTTRLATKVLLADLGLNFYNLLSFETYYNQNVTRYFQHVGAFGNYYDLLGTLDITPWLEYFAGGILDELFRLEDALNQAAATPAQHLQPHHQAILAHIDEHGFITDRDYAHFIDRAKATRSLDFRRLIGLGLIERQGRGRSIYYRRAQ